jgi:outer membrane immunogenic protein
MRHPMFAIAISLVTTLGASPHAWSDGKYARSVAPPFTWTGFYVGGTAGYANGNHSSDDVAGAFLGYPDLTNGQSQGFAGGGTLGVNLQSGRLVYGLETDLSWLTNKSSFVDPNGALNNFYPSATNRLNYLGTVRGRLGLAVDNTLIYGTAGFAYASVENTARYNSFYFPTNNTPNYDAKSTRFGWVIGGGVEHAFALNWTFKGEALYAQLQPNDVIWTSPGSQVFPANATYQEKFNASVTVIRAGLNYKFNWLP